jgi:uracil phosphoribosyltransferase
METLILNRQNSVFNRFLSEIRDSEIQNDPLRFRYNVERMGELLAYEASKTLNYSPRSVQTPLGVSEEQDVSHEPVLVSILRAGLPLHTGVLRVFDRAENGFISAYRKTEFDGDFVIKVEYLASPDLNGKTLFLIDPMLATGQSMVLCYEALLRQGNPEKVVVLSLIGSEEGVDFVSAHLPENTQLIIGAVDPELNSKKYIVPGLGDAGDLAFGNKL